MTWLLESSLRAPVPGWPKLVQADELGIPRGYLGGGLPQQSVLRVQGGFLREKPSFAAIRAAVALRTYLRKFVAVPRIWDILVYPVWGRSRWFFLEEAAVGFRSTFAQVDLEVVTEDLVRWWGIPPSGRAWKRRDSGHYSYLKNRVVGDGRRQMLSRVMGGLLECQRNGNWVVSHGDIAPNNIVIGRSPEGTQPPPTWIDLDGVSLASPADDLSMLAVRALLFGTAGAEAVVGFLSQDFLPSLGLALPARPHSNGASVSKYMSTYIDLHLIDLATFLHHPNFLKVRALEPRIHRSISMRTANTISEYLWGLLLEDRNRWEDKLFRLESLRTKWEFQGMRLSP